MTVLEATTENFDRLLSEHDFLILYFWSEACAPCKTFDPIFADASGRYPGIAFAKADLVKAAALGERYGFVGAPAMMLFRQQVVIYGQPGILGGGQFDQIIGQARDLDMDDVRRRLAARQAGQQ